MRRNREIRNGKECIVKYDHTKHPITNETVELPVSIIDLSTGEVEDITYSDDGGKPKANKSKREKVTLEKIYNKLIELESKIESNMNAV